MRNALTDLQRPAPPTLVTAKRRRGAVTIVVTRHPDPRVRGIVVTRVESSGGRRAPPGTAVVCRTSRRVVHRQEARNDPVRRRDRRSLGPVDPDALEPPPGPPLIAERLELSGPEARYTFRALRDRLMVGRLTLDQVV